jgi:hypothetical protein
MFHASRFTPHPHSHSSHGLLLGLLEIMLGFHQRENNSEKFLDIDKREIISYFLTVLEPQPFHLHSVFPNRPALKRKQVVR